MRLGQRNTEDSEDIKRVNRAGGLLFLVSGEMGFLRRGVLLVRVHRGEEDEGLYSSSLTGYSSGAKPSSGDRHQIEWMGLG